MNRMDRGRRKGVRRMFAATAVVGALAVGIASPVHAAPAGGTETRDGYGVGVLNVTLTGDVDRGREASVPKPPPACWWERLDAQTSNLDATDPEAVKDHFYDSIAPHLIGHAGPGNVAFDRDLFERAIKAVEEGQDITWYRLHLSDELRNAPDGQLRAGALGCSQLNSQGPYAALQAWNFFPTGSPPEPQVDPEILAEYAYEVMDLVAPDLNWNPKATSAGGGSLVYLPTWLWVDDAAAVDERSVTASAGTVSATVTARTDGLSVASPAGTTECSASQAATAYSAGTPESAACTLEFNRASFGYAHGFPVDASTAWEASWSASTGDGGDLAARIVDATTLIPVAESHALVTTVD